jgi:hypothetical protein
MNPNPLLSLNHFTTPFAIPSSSRKLLQSHFKAYSGARCENAAETAGVCQEIVFTFWRSVLAGIQSI